MKPEKTYPLVPLTIILFIALGLGAKFFECTVGGGNFSFQGFECSNRDARDQTNTTHLQENLNVSTSGRSTIDLPAQNLIRNTGFDKSLRAWSPRPGSEGFSWVSTDGHNNNGALAVQSSPPDNPEKRLVYEVALNQCVKLDKGRRYRFAASFKPMGQYKSDHANRVNLLWFQSEDCTTYGQFADYLEPVRDKQGWQRIIHNNKLRSLNAKAAMITITQSRIDGNNQQALWDDIELTPTEVETTKPAQLAVDHRHTLAPGQNHINNGDFDSDLRSWRYSKDVEWVNTEGVNGAGAARIIIISDRGGLGTGGFSQCVNIGANNVFTAGAKVKVDPQSTQAGGGIFRLSWYENVDCTGRSQAGFKEDRVENVDGWQELSIDTIKAPPGSQSAIIYTTKGVDDTGQFAYFIDDVYFKAISK